MTPIMIEIFRDEILISLLQEYIFAFNSKFAIFSFCSAVVVFTHIFVL